MNNQCGEIPAICREVGLNCRQCAGDAAKSLAAVCKGLRPKAVTQLFYQIYPQSACASMSSYFAKAYQAASREEAMSAEIEAFPQRKGPGVARPQAWAAVA